MIQNPKKFRLRKLTYFPTLEKNKLYLVVETDNGYVCQVKEGIYMGFPKEIVESGSKLFTPYSRDEQKAVRSLKAHKRPRSNNPNSFNHVPHTRKVSGNYR